MLHGGNPDTSQGILAGMPFQTGRRSGNDVDADKGVVAGDAPDRLGQILESALLENEARRTGFETLLDVTNVGLEGENDDRQFRKDALHLPNGLDAVQFRQVDVDHDHPIEPMLNDFHGRNGVFRFIGHVYMILGLEHALDHIPNGFGIVDQQNMDRVVADVVH